MVKITQCLIVKNEEQNIPRALTWGKSLFDELIVVDTGSTDATVALAETMGAKVLHFEWIDDFSAVRNFAITHCTGEWIFFLDADEYFEAADVPLLRPLIEKINRQSVDVRGKKRRYNVIETAWVNTGNHNVSQQARIFRNVPYLRYAGEIHEQLHALPDGYLQVYSLKKPAIYHTGYMHSDNSRKGKKGNRNFEIAKKALEKTPDCSKLQLFAAEALMFEGRHDEAETYFSEAMKNRDGSIWPERVREGYKQWLSNFIQMESSKEDIPAVLHSAIRVHSEAVTKFPDDADFDILISLLFFKAKDIMNTIHFFNSSLAKNGGKISEKLMGSNRILYEKLCTICEKLQK